MRKKEAITMREKLDKKLLEHDKKFEILFSNFKKKEQKEYQIKLTEY